MVQWINALRNNSFVNLMRLPLLCEKIGALAIMELGLIDKVVPVHVWPIFQQTLLQGYLFRCIFMEAIHFLVNPYYKYYRT